ncbi:MAG: hypothetical protein ABR910_06435 [Acidobacteriaceae bacterium]|jgi:hypothetical protein
MSIEQDRETAGPVKGMVSVGEFESPLEAQMAKGMLESAASDACWRARRRTVCCSPRSP